MNKNKFYYFGDRDSQFRFKVSNVWHASELGIEGSTQNLHLWIKKNAKYNKDYRDVNAVGEILKQSDANRIKRALKIKRNMGSMYWIGINFIFCLQIGGITRPDAGPASY